MEYDFRIVNGIVLLFINGFLAKVVYENQLINYKLIIDKLEIL